MTEDFGELPVAWEEPHRERFTTKSLADERKGAAPSLWHGCVGGAGFPGEGEAEGRPAKAPGRPVRRLLRRLEDGPMTAAETIDPRVLDRARCIRMELAVLLRQAEDGRTCLLTNAYDISRLADKLLEVEEELAD